MLSSLFVACDSAPEQSEPVVKNAEEENKLKNNLDFWDLRGEVKEVKEIQYALNEQDGEVVKGEKRSILVSQFNRDGGLVEFTEYDAGEEAKEITAYRYNTGGFLTEEIHYYPDGTRGARFTYKYDDRNNLIEHNELQPVGGLKGEDKKYTYKYDSYNNLVEEKLYLRYHDVEENTVFTTEYKLDKSGFVVGKSFSNDDGLLRKYVYTVDDSGNALEEKEYFTDGALARVNRMKYDTDGNMTEMAQYDIDGNLQQKQIMTFNTHGNALSSRTYDADEKLLREFVYEYDERNQPVNFTQIFGERASMETITEYVYDSVGNWVSKQDYADGDLTYVAERMISYYEE